MSESMLSINANALTKAVRRMEGNEVTTGDVNALATAVRETVKMHKMQVDACKHNGVPVPGALFKRMVEVS